MRTPNISKILRYPGGKSKLLPLVSRILYDKKMNGCTFVEPFAGGAGLGLSLLKNEMISHLILNDIYPPIYNFWNSILCDNWNFVQMISSTPITIEEWKKQKVILKDYEKYTPLEQGFSFFFLNRTCFSGIVKGGPIGGINQEGKYKIDCRFNKERMIEIVEELGNYAHRISVRNENAIDLLNRNWISMSQDSHFFYLDPPYVKKAKDLYVESFGIQEHQKLAEVLVAFQRPWLLSYDDEEEIRNLYKREGIFSINHHLNYSIRNKESRPERIFSNFEIETHKNK